MHGMLDWIFALSLYRNALSKGRLFLVFATAVYWLALIEQTVGLECLGVAI